MKITTNCPKCNRLIKEFDGVGKDKKSGIIVFLYSCQKCNYYWKTIILGSEHLTVNQIFEEKYEDHIENLEKIKNEK